MMWLNDAAQVATAAGVFFAGGALVVQLRQRKEQLAQQYVNRFWKLLDDRQGQETGLVDDPAYRRLCEDEFEIARLGWLDPATWEVWHAAIATVLKEATANQLDDYAFTARCARQTSPTIHSAHECFAMQGVGRTRLTAQKVGASRVRRSLKAMRAVRNHE